MSETTSKEIHLAERPTGMPTADNFELATVTLASPGEGEILVKNLWMSVDPYMRGRMRDVKSYVPPFQIGEPLEGGCIGVVVESNNPKFAAGDHVMGMNGWREYWLSDGKGVAKVDASLAPLQSYLGILGMPGLTAYVGLFKIGELKEGETVFVSAASGSVGSLVCQLAKIKGCKVIGSAGSDEKVEWLKKELHVDEAFNYKKTEKLTSTLAKLCPGGIDVYFDNVGSGHFEAALNLMNDFGRVVVCGMISRYNDEEAAAGPGNLFLITMRRLTVKGFIVTDHADMRKQFLTEVGQWIAGGKIVWKETVVEGIENAPGAFLGLFDGNNIGKMLVKLADE